jgi:CHASE2 domain-containing sensor protein
LINLSDSLNEAHSFAWEIVNLFDPDLKSLYQTRDIEEIDVNFIRYRTPLRIEGKTVLHTDRTTLIDIIAGKLVFIGSLSQDEGDFHKVPNAGYEEAVSDNEIFTELPGIEIHALATTMLLDNKNLKNSKIVNLLLWIAIFVFSLLYALKWGERYKDYKPLLTGLYYLAMSISLLFLYVNLMEIFRVEIGIGYAMLLMLMTVEFADIYESVQKLCEKIRFKLIELIKFPK